MSPTGSTVPAALAFSAPVVGGGQFDGASLAGKPAVLWFWASWCPRCQAKANDVGMLQAEYAGRVTALGQFLLLGPNWLRRLSACRSWMLADLAQFWLKAA
jgi:thiol-disulfide isomerase/thioredoxin